MSLRQIVTRVLVTGLIIIVAASTSTAQRGDRAGGGGGDGRSGNSGPPSGQGIGSTPRSIGSGGNPSGANQSQFRSFNSPGNSGNPKSNQNIPSSSKADSPRGPSATAQPQQSFFRGPTDSSNINRDRNDSNRDARDFDRDNRRGNDAVQGLFNDRSRVDRNRFDNDRDGFARTASRIRNDWTRRDVSSLPFRYGWWDSYRGSRWPAYAPWTFSRWRDRPYYWWSWSTAPALVNWFAFDWNTPRYWSYGPGANIYYQNDYVYYDGERYLPVNDYYQRIFDLAHSVPQIDEQAAQQMDWAPLGVFAMTRGNEDQSSTRKTMQVAVNRDGVLSGTYYNTENGHVHPLAGMVDKRNQRTAWAFADGEHPQIVFETSIFNLTKPESTIMVHFGPAANQSEVWHIVRLERPEASGASGGSQPAANPAGPINDLP